MLWASKFSCGRFCLSRPKQPFPHSRSRGSSHRPDEDGGVRPLPSVRAPNARGRLRWLYLCKAFCAGFKCARCWTALSRHILYPYGRPYLGNGCGACRGWSTCMWCCTCCAGNSAAPRPHRLKNIPLACFILQPTGTLNGFLWASKPAVCQPLNP